MVIWAHISEDNSWLHKHFNLFSSCLLNTSLASLIASFLANKACLVCDEHVPQITPGFHQLIIRHCLVRNTTGENVNVGNSLHEN